MAGAVALLSWRYDVLFNAVRFAGAVEEAAAVVVCLCSEYKVSRVEVGNGAKACASRPGKLMGTLQESNACRTEGEYAYRLNKPIIPIRPVNYVAQGWLGALLGKGKHHPGCALLPSLACHSLWSRGARQQALL